MKRLYFLMNTKIDEKKLYIETNDIIQTKTKLLNSYNLGTIKIVNYIKESQNFVDYMIDKYVNFIKETILFYINELNYNEQDAYLEVSNGLKNSASDEIYLGFDVLHDLGVYQDYEKFCNEVIDKYNCKHKNKYKCILKKLLYFFNN